MAGGVSKIKEASVSVELLKVVKFGAPPDSTKPGAVPIFFCEVHCLTLFLLCFLLGSVGQPFQGAYLEISKNPKYKKLKDAVDEKIIIAEVVNKINRANGKVTKWHCFIQKGRFLNSKTGNVGFM